MPAFQSGPFYINAIGKYDWLQPPIRGPVRPVGIVRRDLVGPARNAGLHFKPGQCLHRARG